MSDFKTTPEIEAEHTGSPAANIGSSFEKEFNGPEAPAIDTPHTGGGTDLGGMPDPPQPDVPIFRPDALKEEPQKENRNISKEVWKAKAANVLRLEQLVKSTVFSMVSDQPSKNYCYDEADFEQLVEFLAPMMEEYNWSLPPGAEVAIAYIIANKPVVARFRADLKAKKIAQANEDAKNSAGVKKAMAAAVDTTQERRNWQIDDEGFYTKTRGPIQYLKVEDRTEKADLKDINELLRYNSAAKLQKVFNIPDVTKVVGYKPEEEEE